MSDLESIKAGDQVYVELTDWRGDALNVRTVDKVTAKQIVIGGTRYRRTTGQQIGGGWNKETVVPVTPHSAARYAAWKAKLQEIKDRARLRHMADAPKLPIAAVRQCLAYLDLVVTEPAKK